MVIGRRQHARDYAALLGHPHALGRAQGFDVSGLRRAHDASPLRWNTTARDQETGVRDQATVSALPDA
jgi:hypothetical protein